MNRFFKSALPWLLTVGALAGAWWFYSDGKKTEAEQTQLRADAHELEVLRAENAQMKTAQVSSEEVAQLRKENEDLLRLRNEARRLRDEKTQLARQLQTAQARATQVTRADLLQQQQAQAIAARAAAVESQPTRALTPEEKRSACINNLRQIDGAKQQWALEYRKAEDAVPMADNLKAYFKDNAFPVCPSGGAYTINSVSASPACTIPSHALPH